MAANIEARSPANPNSESVGLRFAFDVWRRWWKPGLLTGCLLAMSSAAVGYFLYSIKYEATTWLKITPFYVMKPDQFNVMEFARNQQELIKSPLVLEAAAAAPGVRELECLRNVGDPVGWMRRRVTAKSVDQSDIFTIKVVCEQRAAAAKLANAIREAYFEIKNKETSGQNQTRMKILDEKKQFYANLIKETKENLVKLAKKAEPAHPGRTRPEQAAPARPFDSLLLQRRELTIDVAQQKLECEYKREQLVQATRVKGTPAGDSNEYKKRVEEKARLLDALRSREQELPAESTIRRTALKEEIAVAQTELDGFRANVKAAELQVEIVGLEEKIRGSERRLTVLNKELGEARNEVEGAAADSIDMEIKRQDLAGMTRAYDLIATQMENYRTEGAGGGNNPVIMLTAAAEPQKPVEDGGPLRQALLFGVGAFLLPFIVITLREYFLQPISNSRELARATSLPLAGEIAFLPSTQQPAAGRRRARQQFAIDQVRYQESIDYLRVSLLAGPEQRDVRSIAICSARPREGKTTLAAHLAQSLARGVAGRVLLVDADMRCPRLHEVFGQSLYCGVADYLAGDKEIEEVIRPTKHRRLDFIAAGNLEGSVNDLLADDRFGCFIQLVQARYDFIIVDTPPLLPVSDAVIIGKAVDGVIFCALRDYSTIGSIAKARQRLASAGVRVLGAALNGSPPSFFGSADYYYQRSAAASMKAAKTES